ncbi:hypothetical protein CYMTET_15760 [Cymbomonas tetramitiformis]|uniref:Uncharacterized protein n=1 Tax=Cymbomonas tetramitiformis TaxID=36881 RepID=A0AAE0L8L6_9CHLO|nr:hypothetical protein CYMTET_15760 [Cymbomonas tetramitiformis]
MTGLAKRGDMHTEPAPRVLAGYNSGQGANETGGHNQARDAPGSGSAQRGADGQRNSQPMAVQWGTQLEAFAEELAAVQRG